MTPLKLIAPLKDYIWGGTKLKTDFNKASDLDRVAESWQLSCHKDGSSVIADGEFAGQTLPAWIAAQGKEVLGTNCAAFADFPILIKLIDAQQSLSVQVHPDNEYALRVEGEYGKTEMWYVVDCEPGATLVYGFKQPISKEEFSARIADNTLMEVVNAVPVQKGDCFFIEAGTLHAIGAGLLIAEIQQNSNSTYRVYDFGRVGADGKPRELHVEKAKDVTRLERPTRPTRPQGQPEQHDGYVSTLLGSCEYFTASRIELDGTATFEVDGTSFHSLMSLEGTVTLTSPHGDVTIKKGDSVFLQAGYGAYTLTGTATLIHTTV